MPPSSWWIENLLDKLILKRFNPFWGSGLPIFGVSRQLSFYERRMAGSSPTPPVWKDRVNHVVRRGCPAGRGEQQVT